MRIVIPVDENKVDALVSPSFGRAAYYLVYDSETKNTEVIENTAANSAGGAGVKAAQLVVNQNANAVITERCGQNAAEVLSLAKIKLFKAVKKTALENAKDLVDGKLEELKDIHPGYHGHGG